MFTVVPLLHLSVAYLQINADASAGIEDLNRFGIEHRLPKDSFDAQDEAMQRKLGRLNGDKAGSARTLLEDREAETSFDGSHGSLDERR